MARDLFEVFFEEVKEENRLKQESETALSFAKRRWICDENISKDDNKLEQKISF